MKKPNSTFFSMRIFLVYLLLFMFLFSDVLNIKAWAATTGYVTATSLNVREKASSNAKILKTIKKNTKVYIHSQVKDSKGDLWYKITVTINNKSGYGYVSAKYIKKSTTASSSSSYIKRTGFVNATSLNLRKSASTSSSVVRTLKKSKVVTVTGTKKAGGNDWYKLSVKEGSKTYTGYVVKKYITLHKTTCDTTTYKLGKLKTSNISVYKSANTYNTVLGKASKNQEVIVLASLTSNNVKWYKVNAIINSKHVTGYLKAENVSLVTATKDATTSYTGLTSKKVVARKIASNVAGAVTTLNKDAKVTIRANLTVNGVKWYRCTFPVSGKSTTGYIPASGLIIPDDIEFEEALGKFPSSYHSYLRTLHEKYPKWKFVAIQTGLDWNDVMDGENKVGKNTIQSNMPKGGDEGTYSAPFSHLSTASGAYDWATDKYTLCDGSNWYTANEGVVAYYMDPRNSLTEDRIFQYEALSYDSSQKKSVVSNILSNTFMKGNYSVKDKISGKTVSGVYADTFMEVGKATNTSPYFLAVRSKQEVGVNGSGSVTGTYQGFEGYYNFYNIGANDDANGGAIKNGLTFASTGTTYNRPWTNPYKAIMGGAEYISKAYISKGQNTNYFQKFNVVTAPVYTHQYMTSVKAPTSESKNAYNSYNSMGILKDEFVFYIPVYKNMPSKPCALPASKGNPNSYVKSITVKNGSKSYALTPTFNYKTTSYTLVVPNSVSTVTVAGTPVSTRASISGNTSYSLTPGVTKTVTIKCTAGNNTTRTYTIKIVRQK